MIAAVWEMARSPWGLLALFGLGLLSDVMWEATMRACEWTNFDEVIDCPGTPRKSCTAPATHTTCDPMGAVVCEAHRCRCSKRLPPPAPPAPEVLP